MFDLLAGWRIGAYDLEPLLVVTHACALEQHSDCFDRVYLNLFLDHVQHLRAEVVFVTVHHECQHGVDLGVDYVPDQLVQQLDVPIINLLL